MLLFLLIKKLPRKLLLKCTGVKIEVWNKVDIPNIIDSQQLAFVTDSWALLILAIEKVNTEFCQTA